MEVFPYYQILIKQILLIPIIDSYLDSFLESFLVVVFRYFLSSINAKLVKANSFLLNYLCYSMTVGKLHISFLVSSPNNYPYVDLRLYYYSYLYSVILATAFLKGQRKLLILLSLYF